MYYYRVKATDENTPNRYCNFIKNPIVKLTTYVYTVETRLSGIQFKALCLILKPRNHQDEQQSYKFVKLRPRRRNAILRPRFAAAALSGRGTFATRVLLTVRRIISYRFPTMYYYTRALVEIND